MRLARLSDLKRALEKRDKQTVPCIARVALQDLPGFTDVVLTPNATFLAICGGTGVGKSALLELLYAALSDLPALRPLRSMLRLATAKLDLRVNSPGGLYERSLDLGELEAEWDGYNPTVQLIGLSDRTSDPQLFFRDTDIDVLKEGVASFELSKESLEIVSLICRRNYRRILVFEIEGEGDSTLPFFEVETESATYDSRSMATGELSAFHIAWILGYVEPLSIVLIEEPESFLPPLSHAAMFALVCQAAVKKRLSFIITTHSAEIASQISEANLLSIRTQSGISVIPSSGESKLRVLSRLGLGPQTSVILFVEDRLASIVLGEILSQYEFSVSSAVEVVDAGGAGGVRNALENVPAEIVSFKFLGVLDGDIRASTANWPCRDNLVFLPFDAAMEEEFINEIVARPKAFSRLVDRSQQQIEDLIAATGGGDHHDRFNALSALLGLPIEAMARVCFKHWIKSSNRARTTKFANALATKLGVSLP